MPEEKQGGESSMVMIDVKTASDKHENSETQECQTWSGGVHDRSEKMERYESNTCENIPVSNSDMAVSDCDSLKTDRSPSESKVYSSSGSNTIQSYVSSDSSYSSLSPHTQHNQNNTHKDIPSPPPVVSQDYETTSSLNHCCESYESVSESSGINHSPSVVRQVSCPSEKCPVSYHTSSPVKSSCVETLPSDSSVHSQQAEDTEYKQSLSEVSDFSPNQAGSDSFYAQTDSPSVSSYKQHLFGDSEGLEEEMEEEPGPRKTIPNDYQSYDANVPVSQYMPSTSGQDSSHLQEVCLEDLSLENEQMPSTSTENASSYLSVDNCSSYKSEENTESYMSVSKPANTTTAVDNQQNVKDVPVSGEGVRDNDESLPTGDENVTAAQTSSSQTSAQSSTQSSGVDATSYAGSSIIQGVKQPAMMSASTVHIAQHGGGATIMQHQSMTAGFNGGMAQSTMVQKQALPNGLQTALLQQRTITNGGQTMLVQQRTMTNVLGGGVAQQTVVQQRVVPGSVAQTAAMQAQALRQRALATHHASMMQHQALRMAHAQARVVGNPLLQTQPIAKSAVIQQAGSSAFIGPRLIQASPSRGSVMQRLVRQRYMGSPVLPARGVHMISGRPVRVKLAYSRDPYNT